MSVLQRCRSSVHRLLAVTILLFSPIHAMAGALVVSVEAGDSAEKAGLRAGDAILSWSRAPHPPANPDTALGDVASPFDVWAVEREQAPRGTVTLNVLRDGETRAVVLPRGEWGLKVRPAMPAEALARCQEGRELAQCDALPASARAWLDVESATHFYSAQRWEDASTAWRRALQVTQDSRDRILILLAQARALRRSGEDEQARAVLGTALHESGDSRDSLVVAALHQEMLEIGMHVAGAAGVALIDAHLPAALDLTSRLAPESLLLAKALHARSFLLFLKGDFEGAEDASRAALAIRETQKPDSLAVAESVLSLATAIRMRARLDDAEVLGRRGIDLTSRLAPGSVDHASALALMSSIATDRGDLRRAVELRMQSVAIFEGSGGMDWRLSGNYNWLGIIAYQRGDLGAAQDWWTKGRNYLEKAAPGAVGLTLFNSNLAAVALRRGDLALADRQLDAALKFCEPTSRWASDVLMTKGEVAERRGDLTAAEAFLKQSLAIEEKDAPGGLSHANGVQALGRVEEARGDLAAAETLYGKALEMRRRVAPGSREEAESLHGLGVVSRKTGRLAEAEDRLRRAADVLEVQKGKLGGAEDVRSGFGALYASFYSDLVELLVERKDVGGAFSILERSRARRFLSLLGERDLILDDEIPAELAEARRRTDVAYQSAKNELAALGAEKDTTPVVARLRELRDARAAIADKIREVSPRLAEFTEPQPLDADGIGTSLEPGTVLLEYAVGKEKTVLFALSAGSAPRLEAVLIPIGEAQLTERIERWRGWAEQTAPPEEFFTEGRALYDLLLLPVASQLQAARRLLVSPDGPLHRLSFSALRQGRTYLVEWKPLAIVPSGTIYAQLARSRSSARHGVDLIAFGDPHSRGRDPLKGSRGEVEALAKLFPGSRAFFGDDASEARAKAGMKGVRYVHFACHGLIDERFPLDSALALSGAEAGSESGLLHAWEIFEGVRLDAELVTLSACRGASGAVFAGEGLLGLTRAFQYAGARSVLASLWTAGDKSTAQFMARFYGLLKAGISKDEGLRQAQVDAIRRGRHPVRWANFQLYGDWR